MPLIAQTDLIEVFHHPGSTDYTLVTFGESGLRANGQHFWGINLVKALDIDCIGYVGRFPNWFPTADIVATMPEVMPLLRGREVITYGTSMGGYGALKHGARLGAKHIIALSPQFTIDPDAVPWDKRYHEWFKIEWHNGMAVEPGGEAAPTSWLVYDPWCKPDLIHAGLIEAAIPCHHIYVQATNHITVKALAGTATSKDMIALVRANDARGLYRLLRARKKSSAVYCLEMVRLTARRGDVKSAEALCQRACDLGTNPAESWAYLAVNMLMTEQLAKAEQFAEKALTLDPAHPKAKYVLKSLAEKSLRTAS